MQKGSRLKSRLSPGEYEPDRPNDQARALFLQKISELTPHVLENLSTCGLGQEREWAERWHLTDEWLIDVARDTLTTWLKYPEHSRGQWADPTQGDLVPDWPNIPLGPLGTQSWDPIFESETAFRSRIEQHILDVRKVAETTGHIKPREKRNLKHFSWLVRFQVNEWSAERILNKFLDENAELTTITKALRDTANLIGLTLRK